MAHDHNLYMLLTEAAAQRQDESALRQYAPKLEELAGRDGHRLYLAIARRAMGVAHRLAGEYAEARASLEQARQIFSQYGAYWQLGRTYFEMGELGVASGDAEMARRDYMRASAQFEAMGAMPDLERAKLVLEALE
jgi:tetratricopeptide (TPR) repeat protein